MANDYEIRLLTPTGETLLANVPPAQLTYVLAENDVGALTVTIPPVLAIEDVAPDTRIEVWRSIDGTDSYCEGSAGDGAVWFVNTITQRIQANGEQLLELQASDAKELLTRRIVDRYAGSSISSKTAAIDDMMKALVREQLGALSTAWYTGAFATGRDLSAYLTVQADTSLLPSISKSFAWRNVLNVIKDLCDDAAGQGTYAAFDIVRTSPTQMEFRTYRDVRGVYRGAGFFNGIQTGLILSPDNNTLSEPVLTYDYSDEANYVHVGGEGEGSARLTGQSIDPTAVLRSPFARRELFLDSRNGSSTTTALTAEAARAIRENRPRISFRGTLVENDFAGVRYGRSYRHGDVVGVQWQGLQFDARVSRVRVTVDTTGERIEAQLTFSALAN